MKKINWHKIGKWALILSPLIIGGGYVYWKLKLAIPAKKAIPNTGGSLPATNKSTGGTVTQAAVAQTPPPANSFPLTVGSNNAYVGQLQDALGITIDNDFGSQTLAALQEQANVSTITSLQNLNDVIDAIIAQDQSSNNVAIANQLLTDYANSASLQNIQTVNATVWKQVAQDSAGNWVSQGYQLSLHAILNMSLSTYQPDSVDNSTGNLIILCTTGGNAGYWSANPNDIVLL